MIMILLAYGSVIMGIDGNDNIDDVEFTVNSIYKYLNYENRKRFYESYVCSIYKIQLHVNHIFKTGNQHKNKSTKLMSKY